METHSHYGVCTLSYSLADDIAVDVINMAAICAKLVLRIVAAAVVLFHGGYGSLFFVVLLHLVSESMGLSHHLLVLGLHLLLLHDMLMNILLPSPKLVGGVSVV